MYKEYVRPLSESERRYLKVERARLKNMASREIGLKSLFIAVLVGLLAGSVFGMFANYPWYWGALFGAVAASILKLIAGFDYYKNFRKFDENSKKVKEIKVTEINAKRLVEFKKFEDLGVMY